MIHDCAERALAGRDVFVSAHMSGDRSGAGQALYVPMCEVLDDWWMEGVRVCARARLSRPQADSRLSSDFVIVSFRGVVRLVEQLSIAPGGRGSSMLRNVSPSFSTVTPV